MWEFFCLGLPSADFYPKVCWDSATHVPGIKILRLQARIPRDAARQGASFEYWAKRRCFPPGAKSDFGATLKGNGMGCATHWVWTEGGWILCIPGPHGGLEYDGPYGSRNAPREATFEHVRVRGHRKLVGGKEAN